MTVSQLDTWSIAWMILALALVPIQLKITAPYGRHQNKSWGPTLSNKWGWVLMEVVSPIGLLGLFLWCSSYPNWVNFFLIGLWLLHYTNRTFIFPFRIKTAGKRIPWAIVGSAIFFNTINAGLNGAYLGLQSFSNDYMNDPRFMIGLSLFFLGMYINVRSDNILINLRRDSNSEYQIPRGFLFNKVSCPNLFGEMVEWIGFAIISWNLAALSFAIWTGANLIPRARAHHRWYLEKFPDYPKDRKAVAPYIY